MRSFYIFLLLSIFPLLSVCAQGIRGTVKTESGEPLPYASIYIAELRNGASTNMQGQYEIQLSPGTYTVKVQYLGYQSQQLKVNVKEGQWVDINFSLKEQVDILRQVEIKSKRKEDPAYTIMRKAIAKRKFHLLQYDSYQVQVYIKGTGQVTDAPFFMKGKLKEEGVKLNEAYTSESVSIIKFEQPNKIEEKVISVRSSGDNSGASPGPYIYRSFYNDKIVTAISPLSGAAFAYYKFRFEGSFNEGDIEVNKIRVIPRSKGENVFDGYLYIIDDLWAIHSLDLNTIIQGFKLRVIQNYAEVAPKTWMPVTHQFVFGGKALGFAGEFRYLASMSNYQVKLNEDLIAETEIIDEKIEEVPETLIIAKPTDKEGIAETLASEEKMTKKQFRKMINQYEKEALKAQKDPQVVSERKYSTDSLAYKRDSAYWSTIRPVPLTVNEEKGYRRDDSLAQVQTARITGKDSTGLIKKRKLRIYDLALGGRYDLSPRTTLTINPTLAQIYYNTVEGFNVNLSGEIEHRYDSLRKRLEIKPTLRYGISSEDLYAKASVSHSFKKDGAGKSFYLEGGKFVEQFNDDEPIHPHINTISSLVFRRNWMKIYEKTYGKAAFEFKPSAAFKVSSSLEWARRNELFDQNSYSFYNGESRTYTSNRPVNQELENTGFPEHEALLLNLDFSYRPGITYRIYNGKKRPNLYKSPELLLSYRKGIKGVLGSDVNFDKLELGMHHGYTFGVSGKLEFELKAGTFLNNKRMYFMDYQHFDGNRTILSSLKPAGSFRLLDYYNYSTNNSYVAAHTYYHFRKFLFTQLPMLRYTGLKENVFFNYLKTEQSPHYYELGYTLDNVFRLFRVELAASFEDGNFKEIAPRLSISTFFRVSAD